jgi:hypothetical protein
MAGLGIDQSPAFWYVDEDCPPRWDTTSFTLGFQQLREFKIPVAGIWAGDPGVNSIVNTNHVNSVLYAKDRDISPHSFITSFGKYLASFKMLIHEPLEEFPAHFGTSQVLRSPVLGSTTTYSDDLLTRVSNLLLILTRRQTTVK